MKKLKRSYRIIAVKKRCVDCNASIPEWSTFIRCYECWLRHIYSGEAEKEHSAE